MEYQNKLKELRENKKISQAELAAALGKSQVTISKYENGTREMDYETLAKCASYFGVSIDYLLGRIIDDEKLTSEKILKIFQCFLPEKAGDVIRLNNGNSDEFEIVNLDDLKKIIINVDESHDPNINVILNFAPSSVKRGKTTLYDIIIGAKNHGILIKKILTNLMNRDELAQDKAILDEMNGDDLLFYGLSSEEKKVAQEEFSDFTAQIHSMFDKK